MRFVVLLLSFFSFSSAQEAAFLKKYNTLISSYLGVNTPKLVNLVADGIVAQKTLEQIKEDVGKQIIGFVPKQKFVTAAGVMSAYGNCLKTSGSKNPNATSNAIQFAFDKIMAPLAKKMTVKVSAMKKNKKAAGPIKTEVYKIANAGVTKKLMQNFLNAAKSKLTQSEWTCGVPALKEFMEAKNYDLTWKKSG